MATRHDVRKMERLCLRREKRGLTWKELSAESGIPLSTLRYYDQRRREEESTAGSEDGRSVSVDLHDEKASPSDLEVSLRSGLTVRVPIGFDADHLSRLLHPLDSGC